MASNLDLEEQEQLAELKHFWKQYGNLITWVLILALGGFAAWNGYQYWQRQKAAQASALYDEIERAVQTGDVARVERALADMKDRFGSTTYASQAGLLAARGLQEKGKTDAARAALQGVASQGADDGQRAVATLRLSALLIEGKSYDEALKALSGAFPSEFNALVADRKGDVLLLQGQRAQAVAEFKRALAALDAGDDYRRLVEAKLKSLGVTPPAAAAASAAGGSS
jgi:predicted negative regulator of RcsB-dependent stress response